MRKKEIKNDNEQNLSPVPCWAAIQNGLGGLEKDLDTIDHYKNLSDPQSSLLETIRGLKDDEKGFITDPTLLRQVLSHFIADEGLGEEMQQRVQSLDNNLEIAEWIIEDGLEGVNRQLAEMFEKAKQSDFSKEHLVDINRLFYAAIYLFPHRAILEV